MAFNKPCIECGTLSRATRCPQHQQAHDQAKAARQDTPARRAKKAALYNPAYKRQAQWIRNTAIACHLCGGGAKPGDPWQADHIVPSDPNSPLAPAHRSCNARRGNKPLKH